MSLYHDNNRALTMIDGEVTDAASTSVKNHVGQRHVMADGRVYRFAKAQDTIVAGNLVVATPNENDIAATYFGADAATAPIVGEGGFAGDKLIRLTDDVSGLTENEYAGGYLLITDATGQSQMYRVRSHEATGSGSIGFLLKIKDGVRTALSNSSVGTLVQSPWSNVDHHTAADYGGTATEMCVGVAMVAATVGQMFWVQTWGPAIVKAGIATGIQGAPCQLAEDDNGSGQIPVDTENRVQTIGVWMEATADTIYGPVWLQVSP